MAFPHLLEELLEYDEASNAGPAEDFVPADGDPVDFRVRGKVGKGGREERGDVEYGVSAGLFGVLELRGIGLSDA